MTPILQIAALFFLIFASGAGIVWLFGVYPRIAAEKRQRTRNLELTDNGRRGYLSPHLQRQGYWKGFGAYLLVSHDNGATWWSVTQDGKAIEPADTKLVAQINGMRALQDYIHANGTIGSRPITTDEAELLSSAGFQIQNQ